LLYPLARSLTNKIHDGFTIVEFVRPSILAPNFEKLLNKLTILSGQTGHR